MVKTVPWAFALYLLLLTAAPASAQLLSYDGFGSGYTAGAAAGQSYQGTGYIAGGTWNNNNFADGGLTHPKLVTTPGVRVVRTADDMEGVVDNTAAGPFGAAGLVGTNNNIGGEGVSGTLYYSFLGREMDGNGDSWGGFNLWVTPDDEQFGLGNAGGPNDYAIYHTVAGEPAIGDPPTPIDGDVHFFVVRADYVADGADTFTAWLDPDPAVSEAAQPASISSSGATNADDNNDGFNVFRMRGDNAAGQWEFDEIRFGTTWDSVTPVVPEPASGVLALLAFAAVSLLRRRRK